MSRTEQQSELATALADIAKLQEQVKQLTFELHTRVSSLPETTQELLAAYHRNAATIEQLIQERSADYTESTNMISRLRSENTFLHAENLRLTTRLANLRPEGQTPPIFRDNLFGAGLKKEQATQTTVPTHQAPTTRRR